MKTFVIRLVEKVIGPEKNGGGGGGRKKKGKGKGGGGEDEEEEEEEEAAAVELEMPAARQAEAAAAAAAVKGVCVVCRRPTTFRCKRCKGVKYWSVTYHPPRVVSRAIHVELFPLQFMLIMMWHCANGIKNSLAFLKNKGAATPLI